MSDFNYKWWLKDSYPAKGIEHHKLKVFSTFACGGGSTMGYKLAGYDVIGANDIDSQMQKVYIANHYPKHYFLCPIGDLLTKDLPTELYNLDIFDGSPPCSTFSTAGSREKGWKKKKMFREGQAKQVLSDLFFDWIAMVKKLQPKIAVAENVKGMLLGNAKSYTKLIMKELDNIGYDVQLFLLNSATMGVPQRRERVFFICRRKDLKLPFLVLRFNERPITFAEIEKIVEIDRTQIKELTSKYKIYWSNAKPGGSVGKFLTKRKIQPHRVLSTIDANHDGQFHYSEMRQLTKEEYILCGSFPQDYKFLDVTPKYLIGMSVPPVMMAHIAYQIYIQQLKPYYEKQYNKIKKEVING